jgi:hypothetical protein
MNEHEIVQHDLPAYAASRLEGPALGRLEAHLQFCPECREQAGRFKDLARAMQSDGEELFEHPSEEALRNHVAGHAADHDRITRHLDTCATCALEAGMWRQRPQSRVLPQARLRGPWYGWPIAAALVAGCFLGAGLSQWMSVPGRRPAQPSPSASGAEAIAGPQLVLPRILRGGNPEVVYALVPGQTFVVIACLATIAPDDAPESAHRYEIHKPTGESVWTKEMTAAAIRRHLESTDVVTLLVPGSVLPPGPYEFRLVLSSQPDRVLYAAKLRITGP